MIQVRSMLKAKWEQKQYTEGQASKRQRHSESCRLRWKERLRTKHKSLTDYGCLVITFE